MNVQTLACSPPYCSTIPPISSQRSLALHYGPLSYRLRWLGIPLFACRKAGACMRSSHRSSAYPGPFIACKAPSIGEDRFEEEVLKSDLPVLVDFWAEWCGPCKLVAPLMDWITQEYKDTLKVYKIDTDANPSLVERYKVYGLPTLILFKNGNEVPGSRREGAINKKKLKALLDDLLASAATT